METQKTSGNTLFVVDCVRERLLVRVSARVCVCAHVSVLFVSNKQNHIDLRGYKKVTHTHSATVQ